MLTSPLIYHQLLFTMAASNLHLTLMLLSCVMMSTAHVAMGAGRGIPNPTRQTHEPAANNVKKLQAERFLDNHDGSFLIPGVGRYMMPYGGGGIPGITGGTPSITIGRIGRFTAPRRYIPGLDDIFVPNPGVEIPNPFP